MNKHVTKKRTDFPIGKSGFYLQTNLLGSMHISTIKKVAQSLYEITLTGLGNYRSDETGSSASTVWDKTIFDADDQTFHSGYHKKITENLHAIFDIASGDVGWPASDTVLIKNTETKKRFSIRYGAPADDGSILKRGNFFIFTGEFGSVVDGFKKHWVAIVTRNGNFAYKGHYKECQFSGDTATVITLRGQEKTFTN